MLPYKNKCELKNKREHAKIYGFYFIKFCFMSLSINE